MSTEKQEDHCILFADIVGSSQLYQNRGDTEAQKLIANCFEEFSQIIDDFGGNVVKTIGDEIMAEFDDPSPCAESAIAMQMHLKQMSEEEPEVWSGIHLKVGIHYGPVIVKDDDVFGNTVNVAARIVSEAKARQILVSADVIDCFVPGISPESRLVTVTNLKGIKSPIELHELIMPDESSESTAFVGEYDMPSFGTHTELKVTCCGCTKTFLAVDQDTIRIGRDQTNDLVINGEAVSRFHAVIQHKKGKFFFSDQSTNGSFITENNDPAIRVHRDETLLSGSGEINLGVPQRSNFDEVIVYKIS